MLLWCLFVFILGPTEKQENSSAEKTCCKEKADTKNRLSNFYKPTAANPKRFEQLVSKPNHTYTKIFTKNLTGHLLEKGEVTMNEPLYTGKKCFG